MVAAVLAIIQPLGAVVDGFLTVGEAIGLAVAADRLAIALPVVGVAAYPVSPVPGEGFDRHGERQR